MTTALYHDFHKYHSLGNDFIVIDRRAIDPELVRHELSADSWNDLVRQWCERHCGIGADGLIVIMNLTDGKVVAEVYNADGSYGGFSGNGARCVAHYLWKHVMHRLQFRFQMGRRAVDVTMNEAASNDVKGVVTTLIPGGVVGGEHSIAIDDRVFKGVEVDVGNPHCIFFETITREWLQQHGKALEYVRGKESPINVEFVTPIADNQYQLLVHERGVGITLACSSGAAAVTWLLHHRGTLLPDVQCTMQMLGGSVHCWVTHDGQIALQGEVTHVFSGVMVR